MTALADNSKSLAEELVAPLGARWGHVQGVASRALQVTSAVPSEDQELLVSAAWLHDIGYAPQLACTGFHPIDGAHYLEGEGFPARLVALVAHHSCARVEAELRGLAVDLARWPREENLAADALTYADMTTSPQGIPVTFEDRIEEILNRYSPETQVHQAISRAYPLLAESVARVEERLAAGGLSDM